MTSGLGQQSLNENVTVGALADATPKGSSSSSLEHYRQRASSLQNQGKLTSQEGGEHIEEDGYVRRQQSDDLMLVQEGVAYDEMIIDEDDLMSEEQLTPLAERESDMDEMSNGDNANNLKQTQGRKIQKSSIANNSKIISGTKRAA